MVLLGKCVGVSVRLFFSEKLEKQRSSVGARVTDGKSRHSKGVCVSIAWVKEVPVHNPRRKGGARQGCEWMKEF